MPATLEAFLQRRPYNAVTDFVDANVERGLANKIAFTDGRRSITYAELREGTFRVAAVLRTLGLRQENRVVLILHDSVDHLVAFWGALRAGNIPIPVNTLLTAEQYRYLLADSRAAAAVVAAPLAPTILAMRAGLPDLREVIVAGASAHERAGLRGAHFLEDLLREAAPQPFTAATFSDEVAFWMYTSGSTGDPKAVKRAYEPHGHIAAHGPGGDRDGRD
jgi:4-hydroxybenzoate-CoA ligase